MSPEYNGHNGHANGHTNGTAPHPIPDALSGRPKGTGSGGGYEPPAPTDRLAEFFAAGMPEAWAWEPRKRPGDKYAIESIEGFVPPDQVTELRILGVPTGNPDYPTARYSGFTDGNHAPWIWGQIKSYADRKAEGFYFVPNRVDPELLETKGRKHNIVKAGKDEATKDKSIVRRVKFYIDTDPKRISKHTGEELSGKHSATAEERAASFEKMRAVVEFTVSRGWPAPWRITDSGNGFHAYYNTDLPADDGGLIKRTLEALAARFDDDTVEVDVTVANAARVTKLYPSLVCKGEHSEDRPWRWAHTVFADNASPVLSADQLEMIARDAPQDDKPAVPAPAPEKATHRRATGGNRPGAEERYADWMACVPESIQGQHGSKQLVKAASGGHGFGLSEATAVDLLMKHFNPRCKPEWSEEEVKHAVANAYKNAEKPRGHLLEADREPARNGNGGNGKAGGKPKPPGGDGAGGEDAPEGPDYILGKSDNPLSCVANSKLWLDEFKPPYWARYDLLRRVPLLGGEPLTDQHVIELGLEIETTLRTPWAHDHIRSAILHIAHQNEFSPLHEYLDGLEWDGVPRIEEFFSDHYGVKGTAYHREVGRVLFLSAVARAYRPGCKVDTVPILIGDQGVGKSLGIAALCPVADWFTDDIGNDMFAGKAGEGLQGKWIIELGELARVNRSTVEVVKSFISRQVDHYRPAYGRIAQDFPRTCVFVGTTNADQPLQDIENRRYLPIRVGQVNPGMIAAARDQLWAEAVHRYLAGEEWWTTSSQLVAEAKEQVETARASDAWEDILRAQLGASKRTTVVRAAEYLKIDHGKLTKSDQVRIGNALKKIGFKRKREETGDRAWFYERICPNSVGTDSTWDEVGTEA